MKKITILLLTLSAAFCCRAQGPVAHYDFNGTLTTTVPDVAGGYNGTIVGTSTSTGTALTLTPGNYVQVAGNSALDFTRWTIKVNLTFNSFNPGTCQVNEVIKHGNQGTSSFYAIQTDDNNFAVVNSVTTPSFVCTNVSQQQPFGLAAGSGPYWASYPGTPSITTGVPYCIIATYGTDDTVRVYINGVQWYSRFWANQYGASTAPPIIIGGNGAYFDGTIDDIELYNYAVSPTQITGGGCTIIPSPVTAYSANQGITLNGTTFMLGYQCGTPQISKFTVDREIALDNHNLNFNSNDQGKLYMGNQSCKTLATRLEISSNGLVPTPVNSYAPTNAPSPSGLRFTNLTAQSQQLTNPSTGVLSLDPDGDVIWVRDQTSGATAFNGATISSSTGSIQFGQDCGTSGGALINDREIPMADQRIFFSDGATATPYGNRVIIGSSCTPSPSAKLEVIRNQEAGAGYDIANKAFAATNLDLSPVEATGVYGEANNLQNTSNVGGDFLGKDGHNNTFGVRALAQSQGLNAYGGWFEACGASVQNWGVYGSVCNPRKGIDYAGYFNGDVTATGIVTWSDENIKKNIKPIDNALNIISKLNPRQYEFDNSKYPSLNVSSSSVNYGVIAQELEQVLPTLVSKVGVPQANGQKGAGEKYIKGVNYIELIPIAIQAIKDQQAQIETSKTDVASLKSENETLKAQLAKFDEKFAMLEASIANICENGCPGLTKKETGVKTVSDEAKDQLFQSIPNPTDNKAIINYFLARNYENATIVISNMEGKTIRNITLDPKSGNGSISIELGEYAAQTYVYSLYINRQIVDSKKMTVIK